jgi:hypothetical protein
MGPKTSSQTTPINMIRATARQLLETPIAASAPTTCQVRAGAIAGDVCRVPSGPMIR